MHFWHRNSPFCPSMSHRRSFFGEKTRFWLAKGKNESCPKIIFFAKYDDFEMFHNIWGSSHSFFFFQRDAFHSSIVVKYARRRSAGDDHFGRPVHGQNDVPAAAQRPVHGGVFEEGKEPITQYSF